jgi:hypothetical protein
MLVLSSSEFDPLLNLQIDQVMPGPANSWAPARRAARESTSDRVIELTGWSITTGRRPCMPIARRVSSVSRTNSVVIIATDGPPQPARFTRMYHSTSRRTCRSV